MTWKEQLPGRLFLIFWQAMVLMILIFIGLMIGEFTFRRQVSGYSMTRTQMEAYLRELPGLEIELVQTAGRLEASLEEIYETKLSMENRILQANSLEDEGALEARKQEIVALELQNLEQIESRILEIEAEREAQIEELEALYEEAGRLRREIEEIQS